MDQSTENVIVTENLDVVSGGFTKEATAVMYSIKALKKRNGASFEDISKQMEEKYSVNMKVLKSHVNKFLKKSVDNGLLDKTDGADGEARFKIKKSENNKKSSKDMPGEKVKAKTVKKMTATKKHVRKLF